MELLIAVRAVLAVCAALLLLGAGPQFRNIGPTDGRLDTVSGVPGDPFVYYAGGLGGLFETTDAGTTWSSIFNDKPVSSVSAIAVAPSQPSRVYIGTGEANLRNDVAFGDGVWRSDDAGKSWTHIGLDASAHISQIAVDAANPNRVFVAALGEVYRAGTDRGIYRSTDGGASWKRVLYADDRTGASSVAIDPADPNVIFAGMWQGGRTAYSLTSGGAADGVYKSTDGGDTWTRLQGHGLPSGVMGRIAIAFAPSNPKRVYALIESARGSLWRSEDGGANWHLVNTSHAINQRPFYFTSIAVDPKNADRVYFMSVDMWRSDDGGKKISELPRPPGFGDDHQMWIDPQRPQRLIVAGDDGVAMSASMGKTWSWKPIAVAQSYHVDVDNRVPYTVCSEDQDAGSACGPSNSLEEEGISLGSFFDAGGGESGWIRFDRSDDNIIYGTGYGGAITRYDRLTRQAQRINVWPVDPMGWPAAPLRYRFQWTAPIALSYFHPPRLYMGGNEIFQTDDGGTSWKAISPDLTRNEKSRQGVAGAPITPDNTSVEYYDVVFCIGPSPLRAGEIWAGTDDGRIWLTRDGGVHWSNVTPSSMRTAAGNHWLRVDYVAPSPFDAGTAYAAADAHKWGDHRPYLFVTHDYGRTWRGISSGLPQASYTRMIRPDPVRRGMLYAGTETALWYSYDEGAHWTRFGQGLPVVPVYDFQIQRRFDDLVVGTHGRGIWILDDLHPLQELTASVRAQPLNLFTLRDAYRFRMASSESESVFHGANPPYGADVNFWLASAPKHGTAVRVQILQHGSAIRTIGVKDAAAGVNRVWWNLRYDSIKPVGDYTPWQEAGFRGPLAVPGTYTVRVIANAHTSQGMLRVLKDPRSQASAAALHAQLAFLLRIRSDLTELSAAIERLRSKHSPAANALLRRIYNAQATQSEDNLRYPELVYGRLSALASVAASADAAPTRSDREALQTLESQAHTLITQAAQL